MPDPKTFTDGTVQRELGLGINFKAQIFPFKQLVADVFQMTKSRTGEECQVRLKANEGEQRAFGIKV